VSWRGARSPELSTISERDIVEWLTHLANSTSHTTNTIRAYLSGLKYFYTQETLRTPGPFSSVAVDLCIKGIIRLKAPAEKVARDIKPRSIDITTAMLSRVLTLLQRNPFTPRLLMMWAAATMGTYALLRPGEFLGVKQNHEDGLPVTAITFYSHLTENIEVSLPPANHPIERYPVPVRYTIQLGITKADQRGQNAPHPVAARVAVEAMWRWLHHRRMGGAQGAQLFRMPNQPALSKAAILDWLTSLLRILEYKNFVLSGRSFRRGGASSYTAMGLTPQQVAPAGRWSSAAMVNVYSSKQSKAQRAAILSSAM